MEGSADGTAALTPRLFACKVIKIGWLKANSS